MSKQQIVDAIASHNRSAQREFLSSFDEKALRDYLNRLTLVHDHRGPGSVWVRSGDTTAIVGRRCAGV